MAREPHVVATDLPRPPDPLTDPDPHTAAQAATVENLLRCWARERDLAAPAEATLRIALPASGCALLVPVRYWSATGWHRFGPPRLAGAPQWAPPADAVTVAALLARETTETATPAAPLPAAHSIPASTRGTGTAAAPGCPQARVRESATEDTHAFVRNTGAEVVQTSLPDAGAEAAQTFPLPKTGVEAAQTFPLPDAGVEAAQTFPLPSADAEAAQTFSLPDADAEHAQHSTLSHTADLVRRVADSAHRTAAFIAERRARPADTADFFLSTEQALLLGHPLHPTAKSREGLTEAETRLYSPELRGTFPLHWFAVAPSLLVTESAWTERGRPVPAARLTERLAGPDLALPDGFAALPLHPWQARDLLHRPAVRALLDAGLLHDLGPHGEPWHPTSSVRTVYRSGTPAMLKLSLGLRITNSRRENLRKELHRGVEVHRLLRSGLGGQWQSAHPGFDIVRDPAWLAVDDTDGTPLTGLDVMIRHNPFTPANRASCIAGLVAPGCQARIEGQQHPAHSSRLAEIIARIAGRTGRSLGAVATEWFLRYLAQVVRPILWLDGEAGIALEAHQQNTVLLLDSEGWPAGGRYRDNQGYYFRESRRAELDFRLPGIGERSDTFVSDDVTDERFAYYLGINNVLGLIGAFGSQRLADERLLLAAFRRFLADAATGPGRLRTSLPARLLDSPVLRCKANLLTRLHGLDELVGPVDTQSVYITLTNPLHF
ncbi:IucA/IucC family protein [Streptomyces sp. NPDC093261]|uniref:IucA/IucC family protein n=1 Tax=Streptomyces sp. NPDC093261 TaxID=3366037 RepID=UPI00381CA07F